jgi:tRNA A22 N-methylase
VDFAVITGIGAHKIARILENGPSPAQAVLHAPDRPRWLRRWLSQNGYRITHERLAPEGRGFAEITRVERGHETRTDHTLWFGPGLLNDPFLRPHATAQLAHWRKIRNLTDETAPEKAAEADDWVRFLSALLKTND